MGQRGLRIPRWGGGVGADGGVGLMEVAGCSLALWLPVQPADLWLEEVCWGRGGCHSQTHLAQGNWDTAASASLFIPSPPGHSSAGLRPDAFHSHTDICVTLAMGWVPAQALHVFI